MALRKTRYVHFQTSSWLIRDYGRSNKGFTARVAPNLDDTTTVILSVASCARADHFCRAKGREAANAAPQYIVKVSDLPRRLAEFKAHAEGLNFQEYGDAGQRANANAWAWIWKYCL